jgi:hypothetical protein
VPWIPQVAEIAGAGAPAPDDYGVPAACAPHNRAEVLHQPVCVGPYTRAAAPVHTLGRRRWLEVPVLAVAAATGVTHLNASGI